MSWIVLAAVITSSPQRVAEIRADTAAAAIAPELQTGSLIVSRGDCLAVKVYTVSPYTHVGAVVVRRGEPFVYDSTGGAGVRCQTLANYLASQDDATIHLFHPREPFSEKRAAEFETYLDRQLGTPYAIAHHVTGNRASGVHCAEYITDAFIACHLLQAKQPARVSPASLVAGITKSDLYVHAATLSLVPVQPVAQSSDSWCGQLWLDTKSCTRGCYLKMRGWVCCY